MLIDYIMAWTVEEGDFITLGGDTAFKVFQKADDGEMVILTLEDDEGERTSFNFKDVETVALIVGVVD